MDAASSFNTDEPPPPFLNYLPKTPSASSFYEMPREPRLKLLVAANGPKEVAYAQAIAVRLSKEPKISIKVIVDDLTHRLTQEFPSYANRCLLRGSSGSTARDIECAQKQAYDLVAWADLLVLAPIDADHMAKMMAGITDTLLLEVLRSWDASKRILLVPGMSTHMWENPVTKRQISKLHRKWHWIRVLPPILWHYYKPPATSSSSRSSSSSRGDAGASALFSVLSAGSGNADIAAIDAATSAALAAARLPSQQRKRVVEWAGFSDLIGIVKNHADLLSLGHDVDVAADGRPLLMSSRDADGKSGHGNGKDSHQHPHQRPVPAVRLPPEIWTMIFEFAGDWELAQAMDVFTSLPMPPPSTGWRQHPRDPADPQQVFMHELEWTLLTADTRLICEKLSQAPATIHDLSALAIKLIFKFALTDVLTYIEAHCPLVFRNFDGKTVPTKASAYFGHTEILDWWVRSPSFLEKQYDEEALDGASKNGYVHVLEWWRRSGLPLKYTEAALEQASAKGQVRVLEWWREASLAASAGAAAASAAASSPTSGGGGATGGYSSVISFGNSYKTTTSTANSTTTSSPSTPSPLSSARNNNNNNNNNINNINTIISNNINNHQLRHHHHHHHHAYTDHLIPLKPGRSLICAAQYGRVEAIRWWEESGINAGHQDAVCKVASRWGQVGVLELWRELRGNDKMTFNQQVLVEPTMYSHLGVLEWWKAYAHNDLPGMGESERRGKQVEYRTMDIEEALEDALGDQTAVRRWWAENGLNLGLGTSEWMKSRYL